MSMSKRVFWLILSLIIVVASFFRFYQLGQIPVALYWDEVAMLVDARSLAETGQDMHGNSWLQALFPSYGDYKQPVYIWLAALSVKFFGATAWALRLPSALAGVGTVIVSGWLAKRLLFNPEKPLSDASTSHLLQLATMVIVAIAPWSITFSRAAFEGHVGQFLVALSLLMVTYQKKNRWWLLPAVVIAALATYTYFSVRFVWPLVFIAYQVVTWEWSRAWGRTIGISLLVPLMLYGLLLLPMFHSPYYAASNQFRLSTESIFNSQNYALQSNTYRQMGGNTLLDRVFFHRHLLMVRELVINMADTFSWQFLFLSGDPNLRHGTGTHGLFLVPFLPLFLVGVFEFLNRYKKLLFVLTVWVLAAALPASIPETTPHALRFLNGLVPMALILGVGATWLIRYSSRLALIFSGALLLSLLHFTHYYFVLYPALSASWWLAGYQEAAVSYYENKDRIDEFYWELADDKFYLWLLAYGNLPTQQIQQLKTNSFLVDVTQFEKYRQQNFPGWDRVGGNVNRILIAGQPGRETELAHQNEGIIIDVQQLGHTNLVLILLERKNE
ncbi:MAG TPA: hypothetical protein VF209_03530 [Patescibacteria group bacterium]